MSEFSLWKAFKNHLTQEANVNFCVSYFNKRKGGGVGGVGGDQTMNTKTVWVGGIKELIKIFMWRQENIKSGWDVSQAGRTGE